MADRTPDRTPPDDSDLDAGDFARWLDDMQAALRGERDADVPCAGCTACCTSSQFVHIAPDETDTLAHIPAALLFPAPRMPHGHVLLGYDEHGHCPLLVDNQCSIYDHRPRTCRTYDCRVFPAAGIEIEPDKESIARRVRRWRFTVATPEDQIRLDAVRAAARFVDQPNRTGQAVLAIETHTRFLPHDRADDPYPAAPDGQ